MMTALPDLQIKEMLLSHVQLGISDSVILF